MRNGSRSAEHGAAQAECEATERFDSFGNHPISWFYQGDNLWLSGKILWARALLATDQKALLLALRSSAPALMLVAFGFECYFKAFLVEAGTQLASRGRYKKPPGSHHDLEALAKLAGFVCSHRERAVLRLLSGYVELGRYPVLTTMAKHRSLPAVAKPGRIRWTGGDEAVCRKLQKKLQTRARPIWAKYHELAAQR